MDDIFETPELTALGLVRKGSTTLRLKTKLEFDSDMKQTGRAQVPVRPSKRNPRSKPGVSSAEIITPHCTIGIELTLDSEFNKGEMDIADCEQDDSAFEPNYADTAVDDFALTEDDIIDAIDAAAYYGDEIEVEEAFIDDEPELTLPPADEEIVDHDDSNENSDEAPDDSVVEPEEIPEAEGLTVIEEEASNIHHGHGRWIAHISAKDLDDIGNSRMDSVSSHRRPHAIRALTDEGRAYLQMCGKLKRVSRGQHKSEFMYSKPGISWKLHRKAQFNSERADLPHKRAWIDSSVSLRKPPISPEIALGWDLDTEENIVHHADTLNACYAGYLFDDPMASWHFEEEHHWDHIQHPELYGDNVEKYCAICRRLELEEDSRIEYAFAAVG